MEVTAVISAVVKLAVALIPVLFFWMGFVRGKRAGYAKGVKDEIKNSDKKMADLALKLYGNDDTKFGMPDVQAWGTPPSAGTDPSGVVASGDKTDIRETGDGSVPNDSGKG